MATKTPPSEESHPKAEQELPNPATQSTETTVQPAPPETATSPLQEGDINQPDSGNAVEIDTAPATVFLCSSHLPIFIDTGGLMSGIGSFQNGFGSGL